MKKITFLIGILIVVGLVLSGCGSKKSTTDGPSTDKKDAGTSEEKLGPEDGSSDTSEKVGSLSKDDLDKLKSDIEGMEIEDLGGLSE